MTASRWLDLMSERAGAPDYSELLALAQEEGSGGRLPVVTDAGEAEEGGASPEAEDSVKLPEVLPILPLRGVVVFPLTVVPLTVGQARSIKLVDEAVVGERIIGLVTSRDPELETPNPDDLYQVGTAAAVHRLFRAPDGTLRMLVQGLARIRVGEYTQTEPYLKARVEAHPELVEAGLESEALMRNIGQQFQRLAELAPSIPAELLSSAVNVDDPRQLVYAVATYMRIALSDAQELLELDAVTDKLKKLMGLLAKELEVLELGHKLQQDAQGEMEKTQREYFLREQMKAIQRELGEGDEQALEVEEFRRKIEAAQMPEEAGREARRELERLARLPTAAAEYGVIRTYLDWLTTLPWSTITPDNLDVPHARRVLDEDHYGLEDVKERILEFLAVRKLRLERRAAESPAAPEGPGPDGAEPVAPSEPGPAGRDGDYIRQEREGVILCFVGPPGVGKTSLGQSIARAMGRKFVRLSLGGVRDEAEIRGHRRTYIGALPGRIIQALRRVGARNPVFMLDEVDKLGMDFRGDPASALLEVLDPEQNREFRDHYLDVPFDLSQVMFITTANLLEPIPGPLRDRMETLQLSGYTEREKIEIAKGYLIPRQIRENGLRAGEISFTDAALQAIIRQHTREAGVRNLEREIGAVCRKVVTKIAEGKSDATSIDAEDVPRLLGKPKFYYTEEVEERTSVPGVATALAWTPAGGDIMFIEATQMPGQRGFQLTGQLGDVMQESARAALSYVRSKAADLGLPLDFFEKHDFHIHVPAGAQPKDGPSAGVTMATALASLISGRPVRAEVGMTGEITLRGKVLPIGGVKEKVLAAHRAGLKTVILPRRNDKDLDDVPEEVRKQITFVFADQIDDVLRAALEAPQGNGRRKAGPSKAKSAAAQGNGRRKAGPKATKSAAPRGRRKS